MDSAYLNNLNHYNRIVNQRNKLLKDMYMTQGLGDMLSVWDMQLTSYGKQIIERRKLFTAQLNEIIYGIHKKLSGGKEELVIRYEPDERRKALKMRLKEPGKEIYG